MAFAVISLFTFTGCERDESCSTSEITFEDVSLGDVGYWNGNDLKGTPSSYESWGQTVTEYHGGFISGNLLCNNIYNQTWSSWSGFACSNKVDTTTAGYTNQYSAFSNSGANGSAKFAVICSDSASCVFDDVVNVKSLMIDNSTYVYRSLRDGNDGAGYVRKFTTGDYFMVRVTGFDATGKTTGSTDIYLADFRNGKKYICNKWTEISLESLGKVKKLSFTFDSTDKGDFGINTPAYCCLDNIKYVK